MGTEGTADAMFRFFHVNNVVPALVIVGGIGQHILGTEGETQPTALTPLSINYYGSFWHVCALSEGMSKVCSRSRVLLDRESAIGCMINCLRCFANLLCAAIVYVSDSRTLTTWLWRSNNARDFSLIVAQVKPDSVKALRIRLSKWCSHN